MFLGFLKNHSLSLDFERRDEIKEVYFHDFVVNFMIILLNAKISAKLCVILQNFQHQNIHFRTLHISFAYFISYILFTITAIPHTHTK